MNIHNIKLKLREIFKEVFGKVRLCNAERSRGTPSLFHKSIHIHRIFTLAFWRARKRRQPGGATVSQTCSFHCKPKCTLQNTNEYPAVTMEMKHLPAHHKVNHTHWITESVRSVTYKVSKYFFRNREGVYLLCCMNWILKYNIQGIAEITPTFGGVTARAVEGIQWWEWSR
jgi:hypothetical protein